MVNIFLPLTILNSKGIVYGWLVRISVILHILRALFDFLMELLKFACVHA